MPKLYPEALAFCIVWAGLAVAGWALIGWKTGIALSVGLFLIVMPASAILLSRTGNFALERGVRWAILLLAALALAIGADLGGSTA